MSRGRRLRPGLAAGRGEAACPGSVSRPDRAAGRLRYQCPAPVPPSP